MIFFYVISAIFLKIKDHENKMMDQKIFQPIITPQKKLSTSIKMKPQKYVEGNFETQILSLQIFKTLKMFIRVHKTFDS